MTRLGWDKRTRGSRSRRMLRLYLVAAVGAIAAIALLASGATAQSPIPLPINPSPPTNPPSPGGVLNPAPPASNSPADIGSFSSPFEEPTINGVKAPQQTCIHLPGASTSPTYDGPEYECKPAAVSDNVLPTGNVMYYDGLEGTENVKYSIVAEYGHNAVNDQSRLLKLHGDPSGRHATWSVPRNPTGGANPNGYQATYVLPAPLHSEDTYNAGALFCSDNVFLPDGRVLANGGTDYYNEPGVPVGGGNYGVAELEGLRNSRIYDPAKNKWTQSGSMHYGRWYPTTIELGNGKYMVAGGVTKLLKPAYPNSPADSGTNVEQTETYDPVTGKWTVNKASAKHSFPLYPRIHLLPDGHVFFNAAGQSFNPFGQSYDEANWNIASAYDPKTQTWQDLGIPGLTDLSQGSTLNVQDAINEAGNTLRQGGIPGGGSNATIPGFRGSTFSVEMPLVPGRNGHYTQASFLSAGGVVNPPSPGSYFSTSDSRVTTVTTTGGKDTMQTRPTGDLNGPRWYPTGVLLPTGQVIAFNGSDRDEVVGPGTEIAKQQAELFDPSTNQWTPIATSHRPRTYHNTAVLLPDGRVLVGGHAPISTLYLNDTTVPGGVTAPNDGRDPSFEVFDPPYMYWGARPSIKSAPTRLDYGKTFNLKVGGDARAIKSVVLVSNASITHLVDADQRNVVLPVLRASGHTLTVKAPPSGNVAPPGPYMLFVNRQSSRGLIPSVSRQLFVGISGLEARAHKRAG